MELWKAGRFTYSPIGRLVVPAVPEAGAMVLMAGHFSATGAESQSTTNGWPAPFGRCRLVKLRAGKILQRLEPQGWRDVES
jgi:hypothetical protein